MTSDTRRGLRYCATVFVGVRVLLLALGVVSVALVTPLKPVSVPGWPAHPLPTPGWASLFTVWERSDGLWFLRIATEGYRNDGSAVFFPLYPLAIRVVSFAIGGHPFAASLIVSNAAFLGALIVLYFLSVTELSEEGARRTVLYISLFPTSFFFFAPYSESLFLLCAVTSFWAARRRRWVLAGVAGALAALTRNVGVILVPALAVEAFHQRTERKGSLVPGLAASLCVGLGTLSYMAYWAAKAGDWLAPVTWQANWERVFSWPWTTLMQATRFAFRYVGNTNGGYWLIDWLIVVPMLIAGIYGLYRLRPSYGVYMWGGLLVPLTFVFESRPLMSMPRFVLPLFPLFWAIADATLRKRIPHAAVVTAGAAGMGLLVVLFANSYYIF